MALDEDQLSAYSSENFAEIIELIITSNRKPCIGVHLFVHELLMNCTVNTAHMRKEPFTNKAAT